jgi:UDP-GlcNAc:polypeptide alpha-N-acetylglucosaminyltransferase
MGFWRRTPVLISLVLVGASLGFLIVQESALAIQRVQNRPRGVNAFKGAIGETVEDAKRRQAIHNHGIAHFMNDIHPHKSNKTKFFEKLANLSSTTNVPSPAPNSESPSPVGPSPAPVFEDQRSIFVSIASYRDEQCAPTITDMFAKALYPRSLYIGIVEQHDHLLGDPKCVDPKISRPQHAEGGNCTDEWCPSDNIRRVIIQPRDAKGPTFGRYHGMLMYKGEKYYMMIDSHNRFVTHWDDIVVSMYRKLPAAKGVLSHYPEAWNNPEDDLKVTNAPLDTRQTTTYLCNAKFVDHLGFPRLDGFVVGRKKECRPQPWAAAGFLFADAKILTEVPFDPNLDYVFDGEEILYSVRMWTSGWDIFSPNRNILYHYYYRKKAKKFWSLLPPNWDRARDAAQRRIQFLLQTVHKGTDRRHVPDDTKEEAVLKDLDKYGLGKERTVAQWYEYSGVDKVNYKLTKNWCHSHS